MRARLILASTCLALWLTACGGGGGGGGGGEGFAVSLATPTATTQPRQLSLGFTASGSASASIAVYRVQWRPDAQAAYAQIGADLGASATTADIELPGLTGLDWAQASVRMQACDAASTCVTSNEQPLAGVLPAMVGYFKASNTGTEDLFGRRVVVSADGQTMAVAATGEGSASDGVDGNQADDSVPASGAVYVFSRGPSGWVQQAYLKASNSEPDDSFGQGLAISADGDVIAVGASGEDSAATGIGGDEADNSASDSGAAYVFSRVDGVWSQSAYLKASNTGASDLFGWSVALSGTGHRLAVSALQEGDSGAAYVFERNATGWVQTALLKASNAQASDWFGFALALSANGSTLAVAAREEDSGASGVDGDQSDDSLSASGAVYVFERTLLGDAWLPQAYLKASNPGLNDRFGQALALSADGDSLAVGAFGESSAATGVGGDQADDTAGGSGAVYTFVRNGANAWSQQAYLKASNTGSGDSFGIALALSADGRTLAVGAYEEDGGARGVDGAQGDDAASGSGAVYLFALDVTTWSQRRYVKAPDARAQDNFGLSLALSADGGTLAVGAVGEASDATGIGGERESIAAAGSGSVYLY